MTGTKRINRSKCYVTELPDGSEHFVRVWSDGRAEAAWRAKPWDTWSPPLSIRMEES